MTKLYKIELIQTTIEIKQPNSETRENDFDYKTNMIDALNQAPIDDRSGQPKGFDIIEMRKRLKVIDLIEAADTEILLDNLSYGVLKDSVKNQRWKVPNKVILDYVDAVNNAEEVEVKEAKEEE